MYGNKKLLTIVACILIFALVFVSVNRGYANPAAGAAVRYAIAYLATAGGLIAGNQEDLDYFVNEYWSSCNEYIKKQWEWLGEYGYREGKMVVDSNGAVWKNIIDYLEDNFTAGENVKMGPGEVTTTSQLPMGSGCKQIGEYHLEGPVRTSFGTYVFQIVNSDRTKIYSSQDFIGMEIAEFSDWGLYLNGSAICLYVIINGQKRNKGGFGIPARTVTLPVDVTIPETHTYTGDPGGFGAALEDPPEVHIPCPPVPPAEWPDRWADDLTDGMTGQGGQVIEGPVDWFKDKDTGEIIYFPPGDPPPEYDPEKHERLVPPVPPVYDPVHPAPGEPGPATPEPAREPAKEPCPYCPDNPHPLSDPCPNPYCPNNPEPVSPPVPASPGQPVEPCPYCPPNPDPGNNPCPNPYCPNNPEPVSPPYPNSPPTPDDRYIDWEPLKQLPYIFTTKFPFSLPWDFYNSFKQLEGGQWDGKIDINVQSVLADFVFTIDLSMFDNIRNVMIKIELLLFDVGLMLATRRLLGGAV